MVHKTEKPTDTRRRDPYSASFLCNRCAWRRLSPRADTRSHVILDYLLQSPFFTLIVLFKVRQSFSLTLRLAYLHSSLLLFFVLFFLLFIPLVLFISFHKVSLFCTCWKYQCFLPGNCLFCVVLPVFYNLSSPSALKIATELEGPPVAMSTSSLRRQVKNIVHNYSEAEIKVVCLSALSAFLFSPLTFIPTSSCVHEFKCSPFVSVAQMTLCHCW